MSVAVPQHSSELLMPAGSLQKLKMAILYGADAIYVGTPDMSLRTRSEFSLEDIITGVEFAHKHGKRVYLTLNLYAHNKDFEKLPGFIDTIKQVKPDGVIIADPAVFQFVKTNAPELELHVSTQANITSWAGVQFWKDFGAKLCVLAREVSFAELEEIREKVPDIKIETFVHGSMCMAYSGRCLISNFMNERGANQGSCANNCRWKYKLNVQMNDGTTHPIEMDSSKDQNARFMLEEEFRPGELYEIEEDSHGTYLLNSRDLCLMPVLDQYLKLGIESLKIEGRNKSLYYLAVISRAYRSAIDAYNRDPEKWNAAPYMKEVESVPSRGYTLAFHEGRLTNYAHNYTFNRSIANWEFAGYIVEWEEKAFLLEVKNRLQAGDVLEFLIPGSLDNMRLRMYEFIQANNNEIIDVIHAGQKPRIRIPLSLFDQEDPQWLKKNLPLMTVARKEKAMTVDEGLQVTANRLTHKAEQGVIPEARAAEARAEAPDLTLGTPHKSPKQGLKACCARGCNGCMIFWKDDKYALARELLAKKKMGIRLSKEEADNAQA